MPRYYFNTVDGGRDQDDQGSELPDTEAARVAAVRYAGDVLRDQPEVLDKSGCFSVYVTGKNDESLFQVVTQVKAAAE